MMTRYHTVQWDEGKIGRLWGWYSQNLSETYLAHHSGHRIIEHVLRVCDLKSKRVVDFGCGAGLLFEHLRRRLGPGHTRYVGVEFSDVCVESLRKRLDGQRGFEGVVLSQSVPVAIASSQADVVFCVEVVEHLDDSQLTEALNEMRRLLCSRGVVVVTTPNREDLRANTVACPDCGCVFHRWQHVRSWTASSLAERMEAAGFVTMHLAETLLASWRDRMLYRIRATVRNMPAEWPQLIYIGYKR